MRRNDRTLSNNSSVLPQAQDDGTPEGPGSTEGAQGAQEDLLRHSDLKHSQEVLTGRWHFGNIHLFCTVVHTLLRKKKNRN